MRGWLAGLVEADDLAGVAEVATALGVSRTQVQTWDSRRARNGFPEPVARLACGPIYALSAVLEWRAQYVPNKGGAPRGERNGRYGATGQFGRKPRT